MICNIFCQKCNEEIAYKDTSDFVTLRSDVRYRHEFEDNINELRCICDRCGWVTVLKDFRGFMDEDYYSRRAKEYEEDNRYYE